MDQTHTKELDLYASIVKMETMPIEVASTGQPIPAADDNLIQSEVDGANQTSESSTNEALSTAKPEKETTIEIPETIAESETQGKTSKVYAETKVEGVSAQTRGVARTEINQSEMDIKVKEVEVDTILIEGGIKPVKPEATPMEVETKTEGTEIEIKPAESSVSGTKTEEVKTERTETEIKPVESSVSEAGIMRSVTRTEESIPDSTVSNDAIQKLLKPTTTETIDAYSSDDCDVADISSDSESSSSDSSSSSEGDSEAGSDVDDNDDAIAMHDDDDDEISGPIRSKNEMDEKAPSIPEDYAIDPNTPLELVGEITALVESSVIIKANVSGEFRILKDNSMLCFEDRTVLGPLFETFGRLQAPVYRVKISEEKFEQLKDRKGQRVYYVVPDSQFVYTDGIKAIKGTDASNWNDEEVPAEEQEYSDDEKELAAKQARKKKKVKKTLKKPEESKPNESKRTNDSSSGPEPKRVMAFQQYNLPARPNSTPQQALATQAPPAVMGNPQTVHQQMHQLQQTFHRNTHAPPQAQNSIPAPPVPAPFPMHQQQFPQMPFPPLPPQGFQSPMMHNGPPMPGHVIPPMPFQSLPPQNPPQTQEQWMQYQMAQMQQFQMAQMQQAFFSQMANQQSQHPPSSSRNPNESNTYDGSNGPGY